MSTRSNRDRLEQRARGLGLRASLLGQADLVRLDRAPVGSKYETAPWRMR